MLHIVVLGSLLAQASGVDVTSPVRRQGIATSQAMEEYLAHTHTRRSMKAMADRYAAQYAGDVAGKGFDECEETRACNDATEHDGWKNGFKCVARVENELPADQHFLMKVFAKDAYVSSTALCRHTSWEWPYLQDVLRKFPRHGWNFLDIGANLGSFTLPVATQLAGTGKVISVEAHPQTFDALRQSVSLNGFQKHVNLYHKAIVDDTTKTSEVCMSIPDAADSLNAGGNAAWDKKICLPEKRIHTMSLDQLYERDPAMSNLIAAKLDCEGCEAMALMGASKFLTEHPPCFLVFEVSEQYLCERVPNPKADHYPIKALKSFLNDKGYDTKTLKQHGRGNCANILEDADKGIIFQDFVSLPLHDLKRCMSRFDKL